MSLRKTTSCNSCITCINNNTWSVNNKGFNIQNKGQVVYTVVVMKRVAIQYYLPCIIFISVFWSMPFHTLHQCIRDNWSRTFTTIKILYLFSKFDLVNKKAKNKKQKKQNKTKNKTKQKQKQKQKQRQNQTNNKNK